MYGEKLRALRKIEGLTQEQVANKLGVSKQTYSHYENEKRKPGLKMIRKIAEVFQVDIDAIFSELQIEDIEEMQMNSENMVMLPIVGSISCGNGKFAYEEILGYEPTPKSWLNGGEYFYLKAKGDSMIGERILDGDTVLIRRQEEVENGEIAAVQIGDEAVLKKVRKQNGLLILESANPKYEAKVVQADNTSDVTILGKLKKVVINF